MIYIYQFSLLLVVVDVDNLALFPVAIDEDYFRADNHKVGTHR